MSEITIKRGDTKIVFRDTPTVDGVAMTTEDLAGATVKFLMKGIRNVAETATITAGNTFEYHPSEANIGFAGVFKQEWELTFPGGNKLTFPSDGYNTVTILDDLG